MNLPLTANVACECGWDGTEAWDGSTPARFRRHAVETLKWWEGIPTVLGPTVEPTILDVAATSRAAERAVAHGLARVMGRDVGHDVPMFPSLRTDREPDLRAWCLLMDERALAVLFTDTVDSYGRRGETLTFGQRRRSLEAMWVSARHRGRGVGRWLLIAVQEHLSVPAVEWCYRTPVTRGAEAVVASLVPRGEMLVAGGQMTPWERLEAQRQARR